MIPIRKDKKSDSSAPKTSSVPYLPLSNYDMIPEAAELIPYEIAKKYKIIPVSRTDNIISVVMENPFDEEAIKVVENFTGCVVRRFIGTHSEIADAIDSYVVVPSALPIAEKKKEEPAIARVDICDDQEVAAAKVAAWDGKAERRSAYRFKCSLDAYFPTKNSYIKSKTINISYTGIALVSKSLIPIGTYLNVRIDLPEKIHSYLVALLVLVVRGARLDEENFCVAGKIVKEEGGDIKRIVSYFSSNNGHDINMYKGLDKRKYTRHKADANIWFPANSAYNKGMLEDISDCGFSFKSKIGVSIGSYLPIEISPIKEIGNQPLIWLTEVARATTVPGGCFSIGVKWLNIHKNGSDMEKIIRYAGKASHK
ncbi:MAG: PilZ domain-containing protein [Candidatus Omnitrophota bacterium]